MKNSAFIMMAALAGICGAAEENSVVRFSNGDRLSGNMVDLGLEQLEWNSELLGEPAVFALEQVLDINLPTEGVTDLGDAGHEAILQMTNGDVIKGRLSGLEDDEIRLKTWYAGELVFPRVNVEAVRITKISDIHYRGPGSMEGWIRGDEEGGWSYRSGALVSESPGSIAREIDFPDESRITFDASWRGAFRPRIIFHSDDANAADPDAGYEMVFQGNSVHVKRSGSRAWLGHSTNAGVLREQEKAQIEIRTSVKTGKILLFVDGEFIEMWEDDEAGTTKFGKGFHLISQDNAPLRISNIVVSEWDGYTDDVPKRQDRFRGRGGFRGGWDLGEPEEEETADEAVEGRMILLNGDTIEGEVLGIEDDRIRLKTPLAEVSFPIFRLKNIALKKADMETPKLYKGDVRATLSDGSRMVFRLDGVEGDKLVGFSQNFGKAEFSKDAFMRLEFNIYQKDLEEMRRSDGW